MHPWVHFGITCWSKSFPICNWAGVTWSTCFCNYNWFTAKLFLFKRSTLCPFWLGASSTSTRKPNSEMKSVSNSRSDGCLPFCIFYLQYDEQLTNNIYITIGVYREGWLWKLLLDFLFPFFHWFFGACCLAKASRTHSIDAIVIGDPMSNKALALQHNFYRNNGSQYWPTGFPLWSHDGCCPIIAIPWVLSMWLHWSSPSYM